MGRSRFAFARASPGDATRGLRLNMANNPKKVKDPTEVALSAIQEALNISAAPAADHDQPMVRRDNAPPVPPPAYNDSGFEPRATASFESSEEPRFSRRPANDDRE